MRTIATTDGRPLNDRPNSRLPRLRAWIQDWMQAKGQAEATILVGRNIFAHQGGEYTSCAGVTSYRTMRYGWGSTWTKAVMNLEANMDPKE